MTQSEENQKRKVNRQFLTSTKNVLCISFLLWLNTLTAQTKNITIINQQWLQYYNQLKLNDNWSLLTDCGYRWENSFQESRQYLIRTGVGYSVNSGFMLAGGFTHLGFLSSGVVNKVEFRPYQELSLTNEYNKVTLNHRYRIEERFFNPVVNGSIQNTNTFNFRFRYSFMAGFPLFALSKSKPDNILLLNIGNELFINVGSGIVYTIFDQNRILISPTLQFNKKMTISITWNSQFSSTPTPASYRYTNVIWLQIKHKLEARARKSSGVGTP